MSTFAHIERPGGRRVLIVLLLLLAVLLLAGARNRARIRAQTVSEIVANRAAKLPAIPPSRALDANEGLHMEMSPSRPATAADTARAALVASTLRAALAKYRDTSAAVADGYKMFMPQVKQQKAYHFTNSWHAVQEAFRFDPAKPTSLLYTRNPDGRFMLMGAMYTAPKRFGPDKLDARVPLSIARWHKHINWCVPKKNEPERWLERKDGLPVFGPESAIATKSACNAAGGVFHDTIFGWMLHANVFAGDDPATVWGDEHAGHDMHNAMKGDAGM